MKISGFDELEKEFKDAEKAIAEIDGKFGEVNFDPHDPASIEAAIQSVNRLIDEKLGAYESNLIVGELIEGLKEEYRQGILDLAANARLGGDGDES